MKRSVFSRSFSDILKFFLHTVLYKYEIHDVEISLLSINVYKLTAVYKLLFINVMLSGLL